MILLKFNRANGQFTDRVGCMVVCGGVVLDSHSNCDCFPSCLVEEM